MACSKRDAGDRQCLFTLSFGPPETYRCVFCSRVQETPEIDMERILEEARKTVAPIIERERLNEFVPSEVMDFKMRGAGGMKS